MEEHCVGGIAWGSRKVAISRTCLSSTTSSALASRSLGLKRDEKTDAPGVHLEGQAFL